MDNERDLLLISLFTLFTVSFWIFFELIKTTKTSTVPATVSKILVPLSPTLETDVFESLEKRSL
ncbi:MAG: hypothetical protein ACD_36C00092G0002 [uncultured bacterium]|uniref:Uncharacterized protein n=1 Tax=Candidatus Gottesmanbacteria bacterium RIFCSPLOWO2_01_FULL_43_11b TaxID=1798392 RepID=A0A1F6AHH2_9BACT|nr:MAG: hypothetical protein ACD_36C00092G0002 [uncultured bacterium]OGG24199.1 MAG: hypothetical protein A3A79_03355 [Candidatus Gottesmanbacteria bacterium RIFCSPLOWO2_01_FULL_43_11b]